MGQNTPEEKGEERHVRRLEWRDRSRIEEIVFSSREFNEEEKATALELVDEALEKGSKSGYLVAVVEETAGYPVVQGYVCYGPTPLTEGVYDLYWIAVDPEARGRGFGHLLLEYVERDLVRRGGRMLLIETSSQEAYRATIRFYERTGYQLVARIKNFYRIGDDKLIFSKELLLARH
jgi:ribosomal protein S18 acetylase RimI-like enzyme